MELSRLEQETIILFNEAEPTAEIYTHNKKLREKLERLSQKHPDKITLESDQPAPTPCRKSLSSFRSRTATSDGRPQGGGPLRGVIRPRNRDRIPTRDNGQRPGGINYRPGRFLFAQREPDPRNRGA